MDSNKVIIIAEAGVNHNGDIDLAKKLIKAAAACGADFVKFQTFTASQLVTHNAKKAEYQANATGNITGQYEMLEKLELSLEDFSHLHEYCKECNIGFLSTGFDEGSIKFLVDIGVDFIKIPSGEITNLPYLRFIGGLEKKIILSTGMSNMGEIEDAIDVLESSGANRENIAVLHCNTEYPTPMRDVNLRAMQTIRHAFNVAIGYSDHTMGLEVPLAAVALGAKIIEKHLTLSQGMLGPDHRASMEPKEFSEMVAAIRNIELAMGDGIKRPSLSESNNIHIVRKSIVASRPIKKGDLYTSQNLTAKRAGAGICPMRWDEVIGCIAQRDFLEDELIQL
jgi:N,N'-diacetyllegionaminate synthase